MVLSGKIDVLAWAKTGSQPLCSQNALHKKKNKKKCIAQDFHYIKIV